MRHDGDAAAAVGCQVRSLEELAQRPSRQEAFQFTLHATKWRTFLRHRVMRSKDTSAASLTVFCSQILSIFFSNRILNLCCNKFDHYTLNVDFLCFLFRSYENVDDLDVETWWLFLYMPVEVDYFWNLLKGQSCYFNQKSQALGRSIYQSKKFIVKARYQNFQ